MTTVLGVDVSSDGQHTGLPWPAWRAAGARFAIIRLSIGYRIDEAWRQHEAEAQNAGVMTTAYHALLAPPYDPARQAELFVSLFFSLSSPWHPPAFVDVEAAGITEPHLRAFVERYRQLTSRALGIYTSASKWAELIHGNHAFYSAMPLWVADYGPGAITTFPPPFSLSLSFSLPPWSSWSLWQFAGDNGRLPGYPGGIDLSVFNGTWADLCNAWTPMFNFGPATPLDLTITAGSKIGLHAIYPQHVIPLVQQAKDQGLVWPLVQGTDNGGIAVDVKKIEPRTLTITRFVNDQEDSAQGVDKWGEQEMQAHATRALSAVHDRLNAEEIASADWLTPINEADVNAPDGSRTYPAGWTAYGLYLCEMVRQADARGTRLALPAFNSGSPEWEEMQTLVATGLFGLMKAGGHILTVHEGSVDDAAPVDRGFGDLIPGAPSIPENAGSLCFRWRYLHTLLQARGELVPIVVSEFYSGGPYSQGAPEQLARFAWYDRIARGYPELIAFLGFTIDPSPGWRTQDYTPFFRSAELWDYLHREKNLPNALPGDTPMDEMLRQRLITFAGTAITANQEIIAALPDPTTAPPTNHTMSNLNGQHVINLFDGCFGSSYFDALTRAGLADLVNHRLAGYTGPAVEDLPLTDAEKAKLIAALPTA
jgi:GH25 family lysozyme M1 (1,4-beta-N-acetylmuramidase)